MTAPTTCCTASVSYTHLDVYKRQLLRLLNTKEDLLPGAILYLRVYFLGMPALALYNFCLLYTSILWKWPGWLA